MTSSSSDVATGRVPAGHGGIPYVEFVAQLAAAMAVDTYLEIGVQAGVLFSRVKAKVAIAVDPHFQLAPNHLANKTVAHFYQMTSDEFFRQADTRIDLGFLDGLHLYEYLLRDVINCETLCRDGSLLILHDCLPLNAVMTNRNEMAAYQLGKETPFPNYWTGDVWKVAQILREYRPDLVINYFDCPPTGLVCISNLDAANKTLSREYFHILRKYNSIVSSVESLESFYANVKIESSTEFVEKNMFSTLYR